MKNPDLKPSSNTSILITGALGFIGSNVAREAIRSGYSVCGIGHGKSLPDPILGVDNFFNLDSDITLDALLSLDFCPDVIIHCGSSASVSLSINNPGTDFYRTVDSTVSVLNFIRLYSPKTKLVLPSSAAVYGSTSSHPLSTMDELKPVSPYGLHKKFTEELCCLYGSIYGVQSSVVRLFSVYGCGLRKQLLWDACSKMSSGNYSFDGTGKETRDWLHISDASKLLLLAAKYSSSMPPIVNGGTQLGSSIADILNIIASAFSDSATPEFSGVSRKGDPKDLVADIFLPREWGWSPKMELSRGILEYVDWYKGLS